MIDPTTPLLERWAAAPSLAAAPLPRVEAELLLAVLERHAADRDVIAGATRRLAAALPDVASAVAHLLALRDLLGRSRLARYVDEQLVALVSTALADAQRSALVDPLTGLGNRRALDSALRNAVARAERTGTGLAVIYFDLVGLKAVNDRHGHHAGDETLRAFATALLGSARTSDLSYRVGGDEFVVLMPDTNPDDVVALIDRIVGAGAPPFSWGSTNTITDGFDIGRLVRVADLRMLSSRYRLSLHDEVRLDEPSEPEVDLRYEPASGAGSG